MKNNRPEIRFTGFSEEWEAKKLGELVEIKDSARISNTLWESKDVPYLRSSDLANAKIEGELFISEETYQKYRDKTGAPKKDDVLFTSGGKIGVTYHKTDDKPVYVQGGSILYARTSESTKLTGSFLTTFFSTPKFKRYIDRASTGLTIKHFTLKPAFNTPIFIPSVNEQIKFGDFFKKMNNIIDFYQRELTILKQTKQGFLQKMFPKEGKSVPEVRFPGFTGDWEQRKLKDIADSIGTGKSSFIKKENSADNPYAILGSTSIIGYDSEFDYEGDFILTARVGANAGNLYRFSGKAKITDNTVFIKGENLSFLYPLLNHIDLKKLSFGTGQPLVKASELKNIQVKFPCFEEQSKIGLFFKRLEYTIDLYRRELDALNETKQAFLQKMFV